MNISLAYLYLALAITLEVTGTSLVKDTEGFTKAIPTVLCLFAISFSYFLMSHVVKSVPVSITYATWSGLGIAAITFVGIFKYNQIPNKATILGLILIIAGVVIINTMNDIKIK